MESSANINKKFTYDGHDYSVRPFEPFKAITVLGELQKILGPAIGGALEQNALVMIAQHVDGEKLQNAVRMLLDEDYVAVSPKGKKDFVKLTEYVIDELFTGKSLALLTVAVKVFNANFEDFSMLSGALIGALEALGESKSTYPENTPTTLEQN